jgi:hypothetical protein
MAPTYRTILTTRFRTAINSLTVTLNNARQGLDKLNEFDSLLQHINTIEDDLRLSKFGISSLESRLAAMEQAITRLSGRHAFPFADPQLLVSPHYTTFS